MEILSATLPGLFAVVGLNVILWIVSIFIRNVSIIDLFWGPAIAIAGSAYFLGLADPGPRAWLVLILVWLWALRLGIYLVSRNSGKPEDRRYVDMRKRNDPGFWFKSIYLVFLLQAILAWIISMPLFGAANSSGELGWLDLVGAAIFAYGLLWESFADAQLAKFLRERESKDAVMDKGVWRYSRHPNYFGEFCLWWGMWLIACAGGAYWTIVSPILLSFFLLKVSGVALLEKDIGERRPAYKDYVRKTSSFIPRPPKD